jgi:hypothetical protein
MGRSLKQNSETYAYADSNRIAAWGLVESSGLNNFSIGKGEPFGKAITSPELVYDRRLSDIQKNLHDLEHKVAILAHQINEQEPLIIELREITHAQAKQEINEYFKSHHGETIHSYHMTEALKIEVELVEEILEELEKEGQIQGVNPHD